MRLHRFLPVAYVVWLSILVAAPARLTWLIWRAAPRDQPPAPLLASGAAVLAVAVGFRASKKARAWVASRLPAGLLSLLAVPAAALVVTYAATVEPKWSLLVYALLVRSLFSMTRVYFADDASAAGFHWISVCVGLIALASSSPVLGFLALAVVSHRGDRGPQDLATVARHDTKTMLFLGGWYVGANLVCPHLIPAFKRVFCGPAAVMLVYPTLMRFLLLVSTHPCLRNDLNFLFLSVGTAFASVRWNLPYLGDGSAAALVLFLAYKAGFRRGGLAQAVVLITGFWLISLFPRWSLPTLFGA